MHNELQLCAQLEGHTGITSTSQRTSHCVLCTNRAFNDCSMEHGYSLMFDFLSSDYKKSWNYAWYHIAPTHIDSAQRHIKFQQVVKLKKLSKAFRFYLNFIGGACCKLQRFSDYTAHITFWNSRQLSQLMKKGRARHRIKSGKRKARAPCMRKCSICRLLGQVFWSFWSH